MRNDGPRTILVIEDVEPLRRLIWNMLTDAGFQVLTAPRGDVALEILKKEEIPIELLLTDVVLPGLCGPVVAEYARSLRRKIAVLYMSGFSMNDTVVYPSAFAGSAPVLAKPFTPATLIDAVRTALDDFSSAQVPAFEERLCG